jgi:hypothetical protein
VLQLLDKRALDFIQTPRRQEASEPAPSMTPVETWNRSFYFQGRDSSGLARIENPSSIRPFDEVGMKVAAVLKNQSRFVPGLAQRNILPRLSPRVVTLSFRAPAQKRALSFT